MINLPALLDVAVNQYKNKKIGGDEVNAYFVGVYNTLRMCGLENHFIRNGFCDYYGLSNVIDSQLKSLSVPTEKVKNFVFDFNGKQHAYIADYHHDLKNSDIYFIVNGEQIKKACPTDVFNDYDFCFAELNGKSSQCVIYADSVTGDAIREKLGMIASEEVGNTEQKQSNYLFKLPHIKSLFAYVCEFEEEAETVSFTVGGKQYTTPKAGLKADYFYCYIFPNKAKLVKTDHHDHTTISESEHLISQLPYCDFTYYDVSKRNTSQLTETIKLTATNRKLFERYKDSVQVVDGEHVLYLIPRFTSWRGYDGVPDAVEDWGGWIWDNKVIHGLGIPDKAYKNTVYRVKRE